ncbi:MAG: RNA methyltransferase, partial [Anaerolineales bacterium]
MITSAANPRIKWIRRLQDKRSEREAEGLFVIEGIRLAQEAIAARVATRFVLHTEHIGARERSLINGLARLGAEIEEASQAALTAASSTETPPGLLAVVARPDLPVPNPRSFVVVADRLADPGNLGSVLRSAWAAGVEAVFLTPGTVDAYNPKVVRGGMGAHFHIPIRQGDAAELTRALEGLSIRVAEAKGGERYDRVNWSGPVALVVGGEAGGVAESWRRTAEAAVHI